MHPVNRITAGIDAIGASGDGIARTDGVARFVPYGVTGDQVAFAAPISGKQTRITAATLVSAGPDRIAPPCPHHGDIDRPGCGGCRMQQLAAPAYAAWKQELVTRPLEQAGITGFTLGALQVSPPHSRRRASLAAERRGQRVSIGFMERGSHNIVDMRSCLILRPELFALVEPLRTLPLLNDKERADYVLAVLDGAIDLVIERRRDLTLPEREALADFAQAHDIARISWRAGPRSEAEPVAHRRQIFIRFGPAMGGGIVNLPPGGFLQATAEGEAALVQAVIAALPAQCRTLDLFGGSGTFTFPAAMRGPVHIVDSNATAISAIKFAAYQSVTAEKRDLFTDPVTEFEKFNAVIFDPPHVGAKAQAEALAKSQLPLIISVSCNPVSFARDAATLCAGGYELETVKPVDQFLWSAELEVVGVFTR